MSDDRHEEALDVRRLILLGVPLALTLVVGGVLFFMYILPQKSIEWRGGGWRVGADGTPYLLNLPGPQFNDEDLARFVRWRRLERVYLRGTSLTDAGLEVLLELPRLTELDLSGTAITDAALTTIARLPRLTQLKLDHCPNITAEALLTLVIQRPDLKLSFNGVRTPPEILRHIWEHSQGAVEVDAGAVVPVGPEIGIRWVGRSFAATPQELPSPTPQVALSLKRPSPSTALAAIPHPECVVHISHAENITESELPSEFCAQLSRFEQLELLLLSGSVDDEGLRHIARLRRLRRLWLRGAGTFTDEGLHALEAHPSLRKVGLRSSHVTGPGLASLATLRNCEHLSLSFDQCDPAAYAVLGELSELRRLSLFRAPLTDADAAFLSRLPKLHTVDLYGTRLTDAVLPVLLSLPALTGFDLGDAPISPEGRELLLRTVIERREALRTAASD